MRQKITHFSLAVLRKALEKIPAIGPKLLTIAVIVVSPFIAVWKLIRPIVIQLYKWYVLVRQKTNRFFHAQHKVLALVSYKSTVHIFIGVLTLGIVAVNITQASEVRAEEFIDGSVIDTIINPNGETTVTSEFDKKTTSNYINTAAVSRAQTQIDTETPVGGTKQVALSQSSTKTSGAVTAAAGTDANSAAAQGIEKYTVLGGETISTIAAKFGVTTKTLLTANTLTEDAAKKIKAGDQIYILPTSGVAHKVEAGDTVQSIADKYKAKPEDILSYNKLITASDLETGVEIIVPGGTRDIPVEEPATPAPTPSNTRFASVGRNQTISAAPSSSAPAPAKVSGGKLQWPTTTRRISTYFGYRHTGLDIDGNFGDPIYAANGGRVVTAGWGGAYGIQVVIDHGNGMQTRYAHLQKLYVGNGQNVSRGQTIGEDGSTGRSTGSHLHFEVIVNGRTVNPFSYY